MIEDLSKIIEPEYDDFVNLKDMIQWLANQTWYYFDAKGISEEAMSIEFRNLPILIQAYFNGDDLGPRSLKTTDYIYEWLPHAGYIRLVRRGEKITPPPKNEDDQIWLIIDGVSLSRRDWLKKIGEWQEEKLIVPDYVPGAK